MAKHAAQTDRLPRAGLDIAVAARTKQDLGFARFDDPVAVLLKLLRRPFELRDMDGLFSCGIVVCHIFYAPMKVSALPRLPARPVRPMRCT